MACDLRCCCGQSSCAYLEHNNAALHGLERDLEQAAKLGQALLSRHETYMAESEAERASMASQISNLEQEKRNLERQNADMVQQNRELLDHLEGLNTTIADSDAHIASLTATLAEAQYEVRRLTSLVEKTADLERQLEALELGQARLQQELQQSEEEERSAVWRWKEAELRLRDMNEQVERIEREAMGERQKHIELVGRMERRRAVEKELESAAGRLKGAAAANTMHGAGNKDGNNTNAGGGTNVVSHFVRDILQDNANLQAGIVELRELLQSSNEEVQNLRDTVMLHQPVSDGTMQHHNDGDENGIGSEAQQQPTPLDEELEWIGNRRRISQEVHVHHHYHAKFSTKKEKAPLARRGSKKRVAMVGLLTPTPGSPMLGPSSSRRSDQSISPFPLNTAMSYGGSKKTRWSVQSAATGSSTISSLPNSPPSYFNHRSSIFDRIDAGSESSRPTSPESSGFASPQFAFGHRKGQVSEFSLSSFAPLPEDREHSASQSARRVLRPPDSSGLQVLPEQESQKENHTIPDEPEISPLDTTTTTRTDQPPPALTTNDSRDPEDNVPTPSIESSDTEIILELEESSPPHIERKIHRSTSHESFVSISGMDIHIPKNSSSHQIFALGRGFSSPLLPTTTATQRTLPASRPLASIVEVHASSSPSNMRSTSDSASLSSISMLSGLAGTSSSPSSLKTAERQGFSQLVGGWVRGKWGVSPIASTGDLRSQAQVQEQAPAVASNPFAGRPPGINQRGSIPGLRPPVRTPSQVHVRVINEGLLQESLAE